MHRYARVGTISAEVKIVRRSRTKKFDILPYDPREPVAIHHFFMPLELRKKGKKDFEQRPRKKIYRGGKNTNVKVSLARPPTGT